MGNSCMGVHCIACQRLECTSDKTGLDQGQIHSTRWPVMTEPDRLLYSTSLQTASSAGRGNTGRLVRTVTGRVVFSASCNFKGNAFVGRSVRACCL